VPANRQDQVTGHLRATFALNSAVEPVLFDFAQPTDHILAMHANTNIVTPAVLQQHISIPADALTVGTNVVITGATGTVGSRTLRMRAVRLPCSATWSPGGWGSFRSAERLADAAGSWC
jgi:hypothetical protein